MLGGVGGWGRGGGKGREEGKGGREGGSEDTFANSFSARTRLDAH